MTTTLTSLRGERELSEPIDGLLATDPTPLSFAPSFHIRSFVLPRSRGDILVYASPGPAIAGIDRHYLNHSHEAMFIDDAGDAPLFVHEAERAAVERHGVHVRATFSRRHVLDEDFEVIPTPGHTPGATAYLWDNGERRFLFTGDTIYLDKGEWVAGVLESSDRSAFVDSLDLIRELDFDVLVPWAASKGDDPYAFTSPAETRRRVAAILDRMWQGQSR